MKIDSIIVVSDDKITNSLFFNFELRPPILLVKDKSFNLKRVLKLISRKSLSIFCYAKYDIS